MKTATIPSLRVEPQLRRAVEEVLLEGESISSFIEAALRASVERRRAQQDFIARGLAAGEEARHSGEYYPADEVHAELRNMLTAAMGNKQF